MHRLASANARSTLVLSVFVSPKSLNSTLFKGSTLKPKWSITSFLTKPLCTVNAAPATAQLPELYEDKRSILLEKLRLRHLKEDPDTPKTTRKSPFSNGSTTEDGVSDKSDRKTKSGKKPLAVCFEELGLTEEVMEAVKELKIDVPTEIQSIGIPAIMERKSVVLGSHTGSGKTLAYLLPLVQLLRQDEASSGVLMKPKRPRVVVLCPTRELCEQVYRVAKSISHHARFRSIMVSGGGRLRPQEDSLSSPIDMIVGTPGRILQHIDGGNMAYGEIKYLVLDEADTMFDRGFGPDIRKFLKPLKNRSLKDDANGFQTILVSATMTKSVQNLIDEEFQEIVYLRTSSLHKKIASCSHDFIKLSGVENKLETLLRVLEPSLAKGNKVIVFCNTLNSSRAVDHFLSENQISTVNYHGEVPAEQRVLNLAKFRSDDGDCPTLVCTDLAARGLDINIDHVIIFDFPSNSVDYVHRTGRTARMGAKGKVTSLVTKKDLLLANRIEEAILKNESLESFSVGGLHRDLVRTKVSDQSPVKPLKNGRDSPAKKFTGQSPAKPLKNGRDSPAKKFTGQSPAKPMKTGRAAVATKFTDHSPAKPLKKGHATAAKKVADPAKFKTRGKLSESTKNSKMRTGRVAVAGKPAVLEAKGRFKGKLDGNNVKKVGVKAVGSKGAAFKRKSSGNFADKSPSRKLRVVAFRGKSSAIK